LEPVAKGTAVLQGREIKIENKEPSPNIKFKGIEVIISPKNSV